MAISPLTSAGPLAPAAPVASPPPFHAILANLEGRAPAALPPLAHPPAHQPVPGRPSSSTPPPAQLARELLSGVQRAQTKLDELLALGRSGKSFTPGQLLALQADASRAGLVVEATGRAVEKVSSGIRQVLQTQL